jgi:hypothetical protein
VKPDRPRQLEEFNDIDALRALLNAVDAALRAFEFDCGLPLAQTHFHALQLQRLAEPSISRAIAKHGANLALSREGTQMMGVVWAISPCICCHRIFSYNPMRVPSTSAITGNREPICESCVAAINPHRIANGLEPIVPAPEAYEPCDETELHW